MLCIILPSQITHSRSCAARKITYAEPSKVDIAVPMLQYCECILSCIYSRPVQ